MSDRSIGFVATKPLQIMNASNVARQLAARAAHLVVVPTFAGADDILARLRTTALGFDTVRTSRTRVGAILALGAAGVARVFVDSDMGLKTPSAMALLRLVRPGVRFAVYEEGVSLVVPEPRDRPGPRMARLGATLNLGESVFVDEVWSYTPEEVRPRLPHKTLRRIEADLATFVGNERARLAQVFWPTLAQDTARWTGSTCTMYLSSWQVDPVAIDRLRAAAGFGILKPHPHIRRALDVGDGIDQVLHASVPAELLIPEAARAFDRVEVLHHGSSAARYVTLPNVHYVALPEPTATTAGDVGGPA